MRRHLSPGPLLLSAGGLLAGVVLACAGPNLGCQNLECGPGTWEKDGKCVPVSGVTGDGGVDCGPHFQWVGGRCVPLSEDLCGPFTKPEPELDEQGNPTGYYICVGEPPIEGEPPPECPEETGPSGEICVNGYVRHLVDEQDGVFLINRAVTPEGAGDATPLVVKIYDPLLYAQDPDNAVPLAQATVDATHGTFRVLNVAVPSTEVLALVVDDEDNARSDRVVMTGVPYRATSGQHLTDVSGFAISRDQDQRWTQSVESEINRENATNTGLELLGCPENPAGGDRTLASCGTWVGIYIFEEPEDMAREVPAYVEGVEPYGPGGVIPAMRTFYPGLDAQGRLVFNDATPGVVWNDEEGPHEYTGVLGSVFYPMASLGNVTGECHPETPCSESGCIFNQVLGGSVPGAIFVQFMLPVTCSR